MVAEALRLFIPEERVAWLDMSEPVLFRSLYLYSYPADCERKKYLSTFQRPFKLVGAVARAFTPVPTSYAGPRPRLLWVSRRDMPNRGFPERVEAGMVELLQGDPKFFAVSVFDGGMALSLMGQHRLWREQDAVIAAHGSALTNLLHLPRHAGLVLFPVSGAADNGWIHYLVAAMQAEHGGYFDGGVHVVPSVRCAYRKYMCSFSPEACRDVVAAVRRMMMRWGQRWGQHEKEVIRPDKCDNEAFVAEIFPAAKS
jgi:hypothetical protein